MIVQGIDIRWLGHDGFRIYENNRFYYIDPFKMEGNQEKADILFITHSHHDHCSIEDIKKLVYDQTTIVCPPDCISKLNGFKIKKIQTVEPGQQFTIGEVQVETVPAYNTSKFRAPGIPFHPREQDWVGYVLTIKGKRIYHAGDTDRIPEMQQLKDIDIALLPVSGTYVMTADEAAQAAQDIQAKTTIPMHYASIIGGKQDAEALRSKVGGSVVILDQHA